MSLGKNLPQTALALLMLCAAQTGHAWSVLGCTFGPDVGAFIGCVNNASAAAVADASEEFENTIDDLESEISELQSSPFLAQAAGEQQALLAWREMPVEQLRACLSNEGLQLGAVMSGAMSNPAAFSQARLNELISSSVAVSGPLLDDSLAGLREGQPLEATPQTISAAVDNAYAALTRLAEEDPVARCALPLVAPFEDQIKQVATAAFANTRAATDQVVADTVRPAVDEAVTLALGGMFADMGTGSATGGRTFQRRQPILDRKPASRPPAKRARRPDGRTTSSRKPLRTRSIRDVAQAATASAMPDDVRRIALAVFTERMLDPRRMDAVTGEIRQLSAAIGNGAAGNHDTRNLHRLLDELAIPSDEIATELGIEVARFYGHWTIDKVGGAIVNTGLGSAAATEAVVMEVGGAICSIGDIFTGAPCAIIKGIVSAVYLQVALPLANQAMMAAYHVAYENAVECAAEAIRLGQNPASRSAAGCGSLGPLLRNFPTGEELQAFALPQIDATRAALFEYQQAVRELTDVAARSGGRR